MAAGSAAALSQVAAEAAAFCSTLPSSEGGAGADCAETMTFRLYLLATQTVSPVILAFPPDVKDERPKQQR